MPDANDILEILIKLNVIGQNDVKAAKDLLADTGTAAKETGQAADYLNPAIANAGKSMSAAGAGAKDATTQIRLLALGAREAGADIPGLSTIMRGLFSPQMMGLAIGVAGLEAYFGHLQKVQQKQFEWISELQKTNDALHEITNSGKSAGDQFVEINKALAESQVRARGHARDIELMTDTWKRYDQAVKDAAGSEAQGNADAESTLKTKIDLLEKAGVLTKQNATDMRAAAGYEAEVNKAQDQRAAKQREYDNALQKQAEAQAKLNKLPSESDAQKKLADDEKALARNEAIIQKMPGLINQAKQLATAAFNKADIEEEHRQLRAIDIYQKSLAEAREKNPGLETTVASDKDIVSSVDSLKGQINNLTGEMIVLNQAMVDLDKTSQQHVDAAAHQRNLTEFGGTGTDILQHAIQIALQYQKVLAGKAPVQSISQSELSELTRVGEYASGRAQNAKSAMGVLLAASQNIHNFTTDLDRVVDAMEKITYSLPNNLKNRLAALEAYIQRGDRPKS